MVHVVARVPVLLTLPHRYRPFVVCKRGGWTAAKLLVCEPHQNPAVRRPRRVLISAVTARDC